MKRSLIYLGFLVLSSLWLFSAELRVSYPGSGDTVCCGENGSLTLMAPNGGEKWEFGKIYTIKWTAVGVTQRVNLKLYKDGTFLGDIAHNWLATNSGPTTGIMTWKVGIDIDGRGRGIGAGYSVRVETVDGLLGDSSDLTFEITRPVVSGYRQFMTYMRDDSSGTVVMDSLGAHVYKTHLTVGNFGAVRNGIPEEAADIVFATFSLAKIPQNATVISAILSFGGRSIVGNPYGKLGSMRVEAVHFDAFDPSISLLVGTILYECTPHTDMVDVTEYVKTLHVHRGQRFQVKLYFDRLRDGDLQRDEVTFFKNRCTLRIKYTMN